MTDDFKKWCSEKADYKVPMVYISRFNEKPLVTLIKAMWNINREHSKGSNKYFIQDNTYFYNMDTSFCLYDKSFNTKSRLVKRFMLKDYNNSEQQALEKALEYIYKKESK